MKQNYIVEYVCAVLVIIIALICMFLSAMSNNWIAFMWQLIAIMWIINYLLK